MGVELKVPSAGESITEVQIGQWLKKTGDWVEKDEEVVDIETDKATIQLVAPEAGTLTNILKEEGEFANVGDIVGELDPSGEPSQSSGSSDGKQEAKAESSAQSSASSTATASTPAPAEKKSEEKKPAPQPAASQADGEKIVMPAAQRLLEEHGLDPSQVPATGFGGRLLKEDVLRYLEEKKPASTSAQPRKPAASTSMVSSSSAPGQLITDEGLRGDRYEEVTPMNMLRRTVARRLVSAQQTAALLTTFNEIDMSSVMELRGKYKDTFLKKYGVKLGFMSFFTKATVEALKQFPLVNAEIRDENIVQRSYYDVGIAIGGGKGLVVPILRNAERLSFAAIEQQIGDFAVKARDNKIQREDLAGGTFTISNGGVYGSLLSTPIVNPPQSGILGLHTIQERPIALNGQVVIRPMMYVALTYDHRIVDGREAVGFLRCIKDNMEDPARLFLEV
ncbi:Dihydrolipoyllysine-residue succinyltransferase component of 2-oxoglutarate dehydrogenase complex [Planctomycetales bacterium 10988]|nr:Dihydrolipoyllysine-residue succinyltransferase component of 2-oxoglutarate dehydrogenase complex [Planctomycetales bacterium 10988]